MQRERERRNEMFNLGEPFQGFDGFGSRRSLIPSLFGGRDPFDDPFFTRPFGSMFESGMFGQSAASNSAPRSDEANGIVIEELNPDDEGENQEDKGSGNEKDNCECHSRPSKEPSVEHPDDEVDINGDSKILDYKNQHDKVQGTQSQGRSFSSQSCRVTYGGVDGAYYTSTRTRSTDADGIVLEESKEADKTTGQAAHRISRGINDKGHSVTRKLNSDGKVDTVQTLHNLNEDELAGFEKVWKGNSKVHLPNWSNQSDMHGNTGYGSSSSGQQKKSIWGGWSLPSTTQAPRMKSDDEARAGVSGNRTKKVVRINIE